ncbi:hypothetical protein [Kibdelosporangium philippinense]|uniref:hypothetical protein n=1 Tax=Kibdelosporangium philippinense TaxID=211113 RepID=UPI00360AB6AC
MVAKRMPTGRVSESARHPGALAASCLFAGLRRVILDSRRRGHHAVRAVFHRRFRALVEREAKCAPIFSAVKEGKGTRPVFIGSNEGEGEHEEPQAWRGRPG